MPDEIYLWAVAAYIEAGHNDGELVMLFVPAADEEAALDAGKIAAAALYPDADDFQMGPVAPCPYNTRRLPDA